MGLGIGFLIGLTGMGGGSLMTPSLILMGISPLSAVGLDLSFMAISKALGSFLHYRRRHIDFRTAKYLLGGSLPASLGSFFLLRYLLGALDYELINNVIGITLAIIILLLALLNLARLFINPPSPAEDIPLTLRKRVILILLGAVVGMVVQFTSVGSGVLVTTVLLALLRAQRVVGTDVFYGFVITAFSGALHWGLGTVNLWQLLPLVTGSLPGMYLGVTFCQRVPTQQLRGILILVLIAVSIVLLQQRVPPLFAG